MTDAKPLILVVDDDRLVLATVVAGLKQAGFDIIEADNGDDAILLARKHKPPLAILDMRMQGKSGMDVARYLAANTSTGFMFLSAFGDSDIIDEAHAPGRARLPGQAAGRQADRAGGARRRSSACTSAPPRRRAWPGARRPCSRAARCASSTSPSAS
ncbi:MAG: response regulator [Comamonadaceae bacterium]|nr:response regulator [Comamonadaceae bacterium]